MRENVKISQLRFLCFCYLSSLLCYVYLASLVEPTAACRSFSTQQPVWACENIMSGHAPSQRQGPHFSLCPLDSSLPLWLQFLFPTLLLVPEHTGFPASLQTSSFEPASEPLQFILLEMLPPQMSTGLTISLSLSLCFPVRSFWPFCYSCNPGNSWPSFLLYIFT